VNRTYPSANGSQAAASLTAGYSPVPGIFDEMMDSASNIRPQWTEFLGELGQFSETDLAHCWDTAQRLVQENGTTYNVYEETGGSIRPWRMDPIPLLIDPAEWRQIEDGLIQRARLLNAIVQDIYGDHALLTQDLLLRRWFSETPTSSGRCTASVRPATSTSIFWRSMSPARRTAAVGS